MLPGAIATDNVLSFVGLLPGRTVVDRKGAKSGGGEKAIFPFATRASVSVLRRRLHAGQPPMVARTGRNLDSSTSERTVGVNVATCCHLSSALLILGRWPA